MKALLDFLPVFAFFLACFLVGRDMMGSAGRLEKAVWRSVTHLWTVAFVLFGLINLYVVYDYPEPAWVNFKLFGLMGLTLLLTIVTVLRIHKRLPDEEESA